MTVQEAAEQLEISVATVYKLCAAGRLGHRRVGMRRGAIRIDAAHVEAFNLACEVGVLAGASEPIPAQKHGSERKLVIPDGFAAVRRDREARRRER